MSDDRILGVYVIGTPPTYPPELAAAMDRLNREVERIVEKILVTDGTVLIVTREAEVLEQLLRTRLETLGQLTAMARVNFVPPHDDATVPVEDQIPDRPALTGIPVEPDNFEAFAPSEDPIPSRVEPYLTVMFVLVGVVAGVLVAGLIVLAGKPLTTSLGTVTAIGVAGGLVGRLLLAAGDAVRRRVR